MAQHHLGGEDERAGVDLVLASVLWCGTVGCFEDGNARIVVDVGARGDANPADLCGQGIGDVVAVEVHRGQHAVFGGPSDDLLKHGVGDDVLDDDLVSGVRIGEGAPRATVKFLRTEFFLSEGVAPVSEAAFGELHDVALVHQGDAWLVVVNGVLNGRTDDTSRPFL